MNILTFNWLLAWMCSQLSIQNGFNFFPWTNWADHIHFSKWDVTDNPTGWSRLRFRMIIYIYMKRCVKDSNILDWRHSNVDWITRSQHKPMITLFTGDLFCVLVWKCTGNSVRKKLCNKIWWHFLHITEDGSLMLECMQ